MSIAAFSENAPSVSNPVLGGSDPDPSLSLSTDPLSAFSESEAVPVTIVPTVKLLAITPSALSKPDV